MKPIWIVDDDQSIRFVLEKALLREDLPTRSFTSPREVLQALDSANDENGPQVLVSDIRMPGGSGLDLLSRVKERMPGLPVIIMTAFSDLDSAVSAFQGGAFEYLPKPFDLPKAIELIRRAVEESQREQVDGDKVDITHAGEVGRRGHVLESTGDHDVVVACLDRLDFSGKRPDRVDLCKADLIEFDAEHMFDLEDHAHGGKGVAAQIVEPEVRIPCCLALQYVTPDRNDGLGNNINFTGIRRAGCSARG